MSRTPVLDDTRAAPEGLTRVGTSVPLKTYIADIWSRREFATAVPLGDLRAQNMDNVLGNLWHLLNPMLLVAVYFLVFGVILGTDRGVDNFLAFLSIGVFVFHYSRKSVIAGAKSITSNRGLILSIRFPRAILPVSTVIGQTAAYLPAVGLMFVVALLTGEAPRATWVLVAPLVLLQALFNLGLVFTVARLTTVFGDMENILPFIFRLLFYLSGILYLIEVRLSDPLLLGIFRANPFYAFPALNRAAILGMPATFEVYVSALGWTVVLLVSGFLFFRAAEEKYGRE